MRRLKFNRQEFTDWIYIVFGTFLTGFGISVFMNPARLAPGGVSGLGTIIYHVIEDNTGKTMELGLIILFLSIPIYLLGLAVFGKEYGIRTLMGLSFSLCLLLFSIPSFLMVFLITPKSLLYGSVHCSQVLQTA